MRGLAVGILVSLGCSASVLAQERDRFLQRLDLALQQPSLIVPSVPPVESTFPKKLGPFTLVAPTTPGEMVRVSIPIGELVMKAFKGAAAANKRRHEAAARRRVAAELKQFLSIDY